MQLTVTGRGLSGVAEDMCGESPCGVSDYFSFLNPFGAATDCEKWTYCVSQKVNPGPSPTGSGTTPTTVNELPIGHQEVWDPLYAPYGNAGLLPVPDEPPAPPKQEILGWAIAGALIFAVFMAVKR